MMIRTELVNLARQNWLKLEGREVEFFKNNTISPTVLDKPYLLTMKHIRDLHSKFLKHSNIRKFHVSSINKIDTEIYSAVLGANTRTETKKTKEGNQQYEVYDWKAETGMFEIEFSEKGKVVGYAIYCAWLYGDRGEMSDFVLTTSEMYTKVIDIVTHTQINSQVPKKGVYTANYNEKAGVNVYKDISGELRGTDVIHPKVSIVKKDLKFFFDNIKLFTDYNLPGQRKVLIAGEPGTGKSSLAMSIADDNKSTHAVVFFTSIQSLYVHTKEASERGIPTICVLEDCEKELSNTHSSVLNFLNGVGQPTNKKGCYVLFTTNHPKSIEGRIKKRPGRIDKIITINAIGGEYADAVVKLYFSRFLSEDYDYSKIKGVFEGFTGAQIKSLATTALQFSLEVVAQMNQGHTSIGISSEKEDNKALWQTWSDVIQAEFPNEASKHDFVIDDVINKYLLQILIGELKEQYKQLDEIDRGAVSIKHGPLNHSKAISY